MFNFNPAHSIKPDYYASGHYESAASPAASPAPGSGAGGACASAATQAHLATQARLQELTVLDYTEKGGIEQET